MKEKKFSQKEFKKISMKNFTKNISPKSELKSIKNSIENKMMTDGQTDGNSFVVAFQVELFLVGFETRSASQREAMCLVSLARQTSMPCWSRSCLSYGR